MNTRSLRWWESLLDHPDREAPGFLFQIADRVVGYADEDPGAVLRFVPVVRAAITSLPDDEGHRDEILALAALAEGNARRAQGKHEAALACYSKVLRQLEPGGPVSFELPRLRLAQGVSLHFLGRLDEALRHVMVAAQGFAHLGDRIGEANATSELARIASDRHGTHPRT